MDIEKIFNKCLAKKGENFTNFSNFIKAEGVITVAIFNQNRLEKYRSEINKRLNELPTLKIIIKDGQWDKSLEKLLQLGIGLDIVKTPVYQKEKVDFSANETLYYSIAS